MDLRAKGFLVYFLLLIAIILILVGDYVIFIANNSFVGDLLILSGIFVAILAIFDFVG